MTDVVAEVRTAEAPREEGQLSPDAELAQALSELRLTKDQFEVEELREACRQTVEAFAAVVADLPEAVRRGRGERWVEGIFGLHARHVGNAVGYDTIAASGEHACTLHWIRNDGDVRDGDLLLLDAGIELDSLYTADVTRTLPVNGRFSDDQRMVYDAVYAAQQAGIEAARPGAKFSDVHDAAVRVIAQHLEEWGLLPVSAEESLSEDGGQHRRWMVHGTSHHLGLDVHDCAQARRESYREGTLQPGMVLTVEPGLVLQGRRRAGAGAAPRHRRPDRGRHRDHRDRLRSTCPAGLPRTSAEVERWMAEVWAGSGAGGSAVTTSPQRRYLPAIPPVRRRRTPLTPLPSPPPSSVIAWAWYVDGVRRPAESLTTAARLACDGEGFVWLGLKDPQDSDLLALSSQFDLHPLAVEDAVQGHSRSKLETFDNDLFMVISTVAYVDHAGAHRDLGGGGHRAGDGLPRRPLRDHRAARRACPAERPAPHPGGGPRPAGPGPVGGAVRDLRQDHRRLPRRGGRVREGPRRGGDQRVLPAGPARAGAGLPAEAGADRVQAVGDAAGRAAAAAGHPGAAGHPAGGQGLLPRARRPPHRGPRGGGLLRRGADHDPAGRPGPGRPSPTTRTCARSPAGWPSSPCRR